MALEGRLLPRTEFVIICLLLFMLKTGISIDMEKTSEAPYHDSTLTAFLQSAISGTSPSHTTEQSPLRPYIVNPITPSAPPEQGTVRVEPSLPVLVLGTSTYRDDYIVNNTNFKDQAETVSHYSALVPTRPSVLASQNTENLLTSFSDNPNLYLSLTSTSTRTLELQTISSDLLQSLSGYNDTTGDNYTTGHSVIENFTTGHIVIENFTNGHSVIDNFTIGHSVIDNFTIGHSVIDNFTTGHRRTTGYFTLDTAAAEFLSASQNSSSVSITLLEYITEIDQQISTTPADVWSHSHEIIVSSTAVIHSCFNSTCGYYSEETAPVSINNREWAVPVTVSLSVLLLLTWIILLLGCRRSRSKLQHLRRELVWREDDIAHIQTENQNWQMRSGLSFSACHSPARQEKHAVQNSKEHQRSGLDGSDENKNVYLYLSNSYNSLQSSSRIDKDYEAIELENLSSSVREIVRSQQLYDPQSNEPELRIENEALTYVNHSYTSDIPESSNGFSNKFPDTSSPASRTSELMDSNEHNRHLQFRPAMTSKHVLKNEPTDQTVTIRSNDYYHGGAEDDSPISYTYGDNKEKKMLELGYLSSRYPNEVYSQNGYNSETDWDNNGKREGFERKEISISREGRMSQEDRNTVDSVYNNIETVRSVAAEKRPRMPKCVSFDETRHRITHEKFGVLNKKTSPNRKISTTSESAMTYLTVPEEGFMSMTSVYETFDNLTDIPDSPVESRFFIGSYSDNNFLDRNIKKLDENVDSGATNNNDMKKAHALGKKEFSKDEHIDIHNKAVNKTDNRSDNNNLKPKDDYIFPIVKKANMKIMAERQHRKLMDKSSSSSSDDKLPKAATHLWRTFGAGGEYQDDLRKVEPVRTKGNSFLSSLSVSVPTTTASSRQVKHPSMLPTIILTRDKDETRDEDNDEEQRPEITRPPRRRRIARANNPFLIEVDVPIADSSEKVRRSSAPSMAGSPVPVREAITKDGMIRSVSGDRLSEHFQRYSNNPPRSISSEFFDLIQKSTSESASDDERLKRLIDDRYNALFHNKHIGITETSRPGKQNLQQDLSPRLKRLMASSNHNPLSHEPVGNTYLTRIKDIGDDEVETRFRPVLESFSSGFQLTKYSNTTTSSEPDRLLSRNHLDSQMNNDIPSKEKVEKLSNSVNNTLIPEIKPNFKTSFIQGLGINSPRPSLAYGTDGQDSDTESQKAVSLAPSLRKADVNEGKQRQHTEIGSYKKILKNERKSPLSKLSWESFEDDFDKKHPSTNTQNSEKVFISEKSKRSGHLLSRISERPSNNKAQIDLTLLRNDNKQGNPISLPVKEAKTERRDETNALKQIAESADDSNAFTSSSFVPTDTSLLKYEPTSTSQSGISSSHAFSSLKRGSFDDNFTINKHIQGEKSIAQAESSKNVNNQPLQKQSEQKSTNEIKKTLHKTILIPPEKPIRKSKERRLRNEKFTRPSSSSLFGERKDKQATTVQKECSHNEDKSVPLTNINRDIAETTLEASGYSQKNTKSFSSRSLSLDESSNLSNRRNRRAVTLETDKLASHFTRAKDWSKLFSQDKSRFVSSANNTLLEHTAAEEMTHVDTILIDSEKALHYKPTSYSLNVNEKKESQKEPKPFMLDEDIDDELRISFV